MALRRLCKDTRKRPRHALFFFPNENKTGIAPTRLIFVEKDSELTEGMKVKVNWQGKRAYGEIVALNDDEEVLNSIDIEWSKENLPEMSSLEEENIEPPRKVARPDKVKPGTEKPSTTVRTQPSNLEVSRQSTAEVSRESTTGVSRESTAEVSCESTLVVNRPSTPVATPEISPQPAQKDYYQTFLAEQQNRDGKWSANREASRLQKTKVTSDNSRDEISVLKQQLQAKDQECALLRDQLRVQERLCKMMENFEDSLAAMEGNMAQRLSRIEQRLESLETVFTSPVNLDPLSVSLSASVPPLHDLSTIDVDAFESLSAEVDPTSSPAPASLETPAAPAVESPVAPTPPPASTVSSNSSAESAVEVPVAEDVIRTCVTPRKVQRVREALQKEVRRHRCAVNLLPFFFTKEEIMTSNCNGSHGKLCLDSNKLNSLKVLVFSKFPVESATEKDKAWAFIKTKINARCRATKFANSTRAE